MNIVKILKSVGGIVADSHFVGTSGRHMPAYVNKDALLPHTKQTALVGKLFAEKYKTKAIDFVVAPAVAGIPFSQWTAYYLSKLKGKEVLSIFTEKTTENDQIFKRGYDTLIKGKKVLVVEDTVTTGGSVQRVIASVRKAGGIVVGACVMINRDPKLVNEASIGAPFGALATFEIESWEAADCPLCKSGIPINTKLGHGKKFLEEQKKK